MLLSFAALMLLGFVSAAAFEFVSDSKANAVRDCANMVRE